MAMHSPTQKLFAAAVFSLLLPQALKAQSDSILPLIEVDTFYITPAQSADFSSPISHTNLENADFRRQNFGQEGTFLLSQLTPSITLHSDAGSYQGYSYMRLRGIDQTRINLSVNGIPLNEPEDQGAYFSNHADILNSVSQIQVQRGVGLSQSGAAAYAGNVQLYLNRFSQRPELEVGGGYGSFGSYRGYAAFSSGGLLDGRLNISARLSVLGSEGFKNHSGNSSQSAYLRAYYTRQEHIFHLLHITGRQANQMAWLGVSDSLLQINPRHNANSEQEKDLFLQSLTGLTHSYSRFFDENNLFIWENKLYYTYLDGNYGFDFNNFLGLPSTSELYNYAFRSHFVGALSTVKVLLPTTTLSAGLHGNYYERRHIGSELALGKLYENKGIKPEFSAFLRGEQSVFKRLGLFADLQLRATSFTYEGAINLAPINWLFFNPKLGISYEPIDNMLLYASAGIAHREPTRNDMFFGNDDLAADSLSLPLIGDSRAERVIDYELGMRYERKGKFNASLNLFYMDFNNERTLNGAVGLNGLPLTSNVDNSWRSGVEWSAGWRLPKGFHLLQTGVVMWAEIEQQGTRFSPILTPRAVINNALQWESAFGLWAEVNLRYQAAAYMDFANSQTLPAYWLLGASVGYEWKGWRFSIMGNNLTNVRYFNNGYVDFDGTNKYFLQAPINVYGTIAKTFGLRKKPQ